MSKAKSDVAAAPGSRPSLVYVVAVNQKEADDVAWLIGLPIRKEAEAHLKQVQAPPTDPYYASQYRVYKVALNQRAAAKTETTSPSKRLVKEN